MNKSSFIKNRIIIMAVLLLAAFAACKKEDSRTITATLERFSCDTKAYINSQHFACWNNGDEVSINGTSHTVSINDDGSATIADVPTGELTAFYPAHRIEGTTVTFPMVQEYNKDDSGRQLIDNPMAAYTAEGNELRFRNLGALIEVTLKPASTIMVKAIEVKGNDDQMLWGESTLAVDDGIPHLSTLTNGGSSVVLHFGTPEEVTAEGKAFYIVVPAHSKFETFTISVLNVAVYSFFYTSPSKSKYIDQSIPRNHIGAITYTLDNDDSYQPSWMIKYTSTNINPVEPNPHDWNANFLNEINGQLLFDNALTSIPGDAFYWRENLATISLPYTITSIGACAFESCTNLTSISLPNSLTSIGNSAFYECRSLTSISLPNSITSIGNQTFYMCINLASISLPNNLTSIGDEAFLRCNVLDNISLPNSLTTIGNYAFSDCYNFTSITIPSNVTHIGENTFINCYHLSTIYCKPHTPPTIGTGCFGYNVSAIYVPYDAVNDYRDAPNWSWYYPYIQGYSF